jgi:putative addiction module killer protein
VVRGVKFRGCGKGDSGGHPATGNCSNVQSVGQGVHEYKINFGPGYRVYFGKDGEELIILLAGGTKKKQSNDIAAAQAFWADYKKRKKEES